MKKLRGKYRYMVNGLRVVSLMVGMVILSTGSVLAQSDFFSNTQGTDLRNGFGGATNTAPANPGFNPCSGTSGTPATNTAGVCALAAPTSLLTTANLGTATGGGIFQEAGPGAVTDNMFAHVSKTALGTDGAAAGANAAADTDTSKCAPAMGVTGGVGLAGFDSSNGGLNGLNCGGIRITPNTQGMSIPTFPATNSLDQTLTGSAGLSFDSAPATPVANTHTGFLITNDFVWIPNATDSTTAPITCAPLAGASAATPNFCSSQRVNQVTSINGIGGTVATPVLGQDQVVDFTTTFQVAAEDGVLDFPANAFNVVITSIIDDPDMSNTAGAASGFRQTIGLTFSHDADADLVTAGQQNQEFTCGAASGTNVAVGCSNYPTGASQTSGFTAKTDLDPPFLP